jgi:hypothetical protein
MLYLGYEHALGNNIQVKDDRAGVICQIFDRSMLLSEYVNKVYIKEVEYANDKSFT